MPVNQQSLSQENSPSTPPEAPVHLYANTSGGIIGDTTAVDLVRDPLSLRFRLCLFGPKKYAVADRFDVGPMVFLPARISTAFARQVRWPDRCGDFLSAAKLTSALRAILQAEGFEPDTAAKAAYWVLASCFVDVLPAAPNLVISGSRPSASFLLQLLSCMVRRGLVIDGFRRNALRALQMQLRPTLLISSPLDKASRQLILTSSRPGMLVPCGDQLVDAFSAKAIYAGPIPELSIGDALHVSLPPMSARLPVLTQTRADEIAADIQPEILAYRGQNIFKVRNSKFNASKIDPNLRLAGHIFAAPLVGARTLEHELISLIAKSEKPFSEPGWTDMPAVLLESAVHLAHLRFGERVAIGEFAEEANKLLVLRGDRTKHSAREVGPILAGFGLKTEARSSANTILLDAAASRRVHLLASQTSLLNFAPKKQCPFCDELATSKSNKTGRPS